MFRKSGNSWRFALSRTAMAVCLVWFFAIDSNAQEDLTAPPRIVDETTPPSRAPSPPPPSRSTEELEEIIVISDQNPWRLPDLGSTWRDPLADQADNGRIDADLLPIWNPAAEEIPTRDLYEPGENFRRSGFIEIFRVRFGRR